MATMPGIIVGIMVPLAAGSCLPEAIPLAERQNLVTWWMEIQVKVTSGLIHFVTFFSCNSAASGIVCAIWLSCTRLSWRHIFVISVRSMAYLRSLFWSFFDSAKAVCQVLRRLQKQIFRMTRTYAWIKAKEFGSNLVGKASWNSVRDVVFEGELHLLSSLRGGTCRKSKNRLRRKKLKKGALGRVAPCSSFISPGSSLGEGEPTSDVNLLALLEPSWEQDDIHDVLSPTLELWEPHEHLKSISYYDLCGSFWTSYTSDFGSWTEQNDHEHHLDEEKGKDLDEELAAATFISEHNQLEQIATSPSLLGASSSPTLVEDSYGDLECEDEDIIRIFLRSSDIALRGGTIPGLAKVLGGQVRGGAGGSHATKKRKDLQNIINDLEAWINDENEEDGDEPLQHTMQQALETLKQWKKDKPQHGQAASLLQQIVHRIGESASHSPGAATYKTPMTGAERGQTFYNALHKQQDGWQKVTHKKGKGGKAKGKGKEAPLLPRYDLTRKWPRAQIVTWQSVQHALEAGEQPKGNVAICKDCLHMAELQKMSKALGFNKKLVLVAKDNQTLDDHSVEGLETMMLPYYGNLALVQAKVACLSGGQPEVKKDEIKKVELKAEDCEMITLRVIVALKYVAAALHETLCSKPDYSLKLLGISEQIKTFQWVRNKEELNGYISVPAGKIQDYLKKSGIGGVFLVQLTKDVLSKPDVTWIQPNEGENAQDYFKRALKAANDNKVGLAFRRGGAADVGILKKNDSVLDKPFAVWGIPGYMSPGAVQTWLQEQGWTCKSMPSESRSTKGPWRIYGHNAVLPEQDSFNYSLTVSGKERMISIVPWKSNRKADDVSQPVLRKTWYWPEKVFDEEVLSPTVSFTAIPPTAMDTQSQDEDGGDGKGKAEKHGSTTKLSPEKKRHKAAIDTKVVGGMAGPKFSGTTSTILDCGGAGDCGWRCLGVLVAGLNSKEISQAIRDKAHDLGKALKAQALHHLTCDTTWEDTWVVDDQWTWQTEDGKPASNLTEFKEVLKREGRWIDHYGLMAVSTIKKVVINVWRYEGANVWSIIAKLSPPEAHDKTPAVNLVLYSGHYFAVVKRNKADKEQYEIKDHVWVSKGICNDVIGNVKTGIFRGGASSCQTPKKRKAGQNSEDEEIQHLLRSCKSLDEAGQEEELQELLRTVSTLKKTPHADNDNLEHLLRSCSSLASSEKGQGSKKQPAWACPFCPYQIDTKDSRTWVAVASHLSKLHSSEKMKAQAACRDNGTSPAFCGLGLKKLLIPVAFQSIPKTADKVCFRCPYCSLGIFDQEISKFLLKKSKLQHLKVCKKKPQKKVTLRRYKGDCMAAKDKGTDVTNRSRVQKSAEKILQNTLEKATARGHRPVHFPCKWAQKKTFLEHLRLPGLPCFQQRLAEGLVPGLQKRACPLKKGHCRPWCCLVEQIWNGQRLGVYYEQDGNHWTGKGPDQEGGPGVQAYGGQQKTPPLKQKEVKSQANQFHCTWG